MSRLWIVIGYLMRAVNWAVVMAASVFFLLYVADQGWAVDLVQKLRAPDVKELLIMIAIAAGLFLLNGLAFLSLLRPRRYLNYITFANPKGKVMVSVPALQEALSRILLVQPSVHDVRVRILVPRAKRRKRPIRVIAGISLKESQDVLATEMRFQDILERKLTDILRTDEKVEYNIRLERFRFEKPSRGQKEVEETFEATFRGPQYPIELEEEEEK